MNTRQLLESGCRGLRQAPPIVAVVLTLPRVSNRQSPLKRRLVTGINVCISTRGASAEPAALAMMASNIAGLQPLDATYLTRIVGCRAALQDLGKTCKTLPPHCKTWFNHILQSNIEKQRAGCLGSSVSRHILQRSCKIAIGSKVELNDPTEVGQVGFEIVDLVSYFVCWLFQGFACSLLAEWFTERRGARSGQCRQERRLQSSRRISHGAALGVVAASADAWIFDDL